LLVVGGTLFAMDLSDPTTLSHFLEIYGSLPRAGPGTAEDTLRALDLVPIENIRGVLDLGCGPGAQTLVLAEALPEARILALDLLPEMAAEARRRMVEKGLEGRVRVEVGDMMSPDVAPGSQDLIWCEGAIYFAGISNALTSWRSFLAPGGCVAFTEPIWLEPSPPGEIVHWWQREYPAITDESGVRTAVGNAAFETVGFFVLPADSWWKDYYGPMEERTEQFKAAHVGDPLAVEIAARAEEEVAMFRRFNTSYSYGFFVVRPVES
jgi:SAM-dependent methyltransferase